VALEQDLLFLKQLVESERLKPVINRTYPLADTAVALAYIESGHVPGKVVVTVQ
jgi:NADPH:quinone reductase-like Zn-dependent oxidoreductase